jgi:hypothetical protein
MEVDENDELVSFSMCDAHGDNTLAFRFLRRETVGRSPPNFTVANVKLQPPSVDAKEVGKDGNKDVAESGLDDGRKPGHYEIRVLPPSKTRPHLIPKTRVVNEEETKSNPFKNLLLPSAKRKADTEAYGAGGPAQKK